MMTRSLCLALAGLIVWLGGISAAIAEKRVALVIGNAAYEHTSRLANPRRDAELMAAALTRAGFGVTKLLDADQKSMKRAMRDLGRALRGSDAVGLFYYAGHGVQVRGENYLIPIDANIKDQSEAGIEGVNVNEFLATMERAQSRINIIVLDACRDNPFAAGSRSATRGLARVSAPSGSYIAYATSPGAVALDGKGANSPYARALSRAIATPGLTIEQVFKKTRASVQATTNRQQTPWETSSITGEFYFLPGQGGQTKTDAAQPLTPPVPPAKDDRAVELAYWNSIKDGASKAAFEAYLKDYPSGAFTALARLKIQELSRPKQPVSPPTQPVQRHGGSSRPPVFPASSRLALASGQLQALSCQQLWVARNEIYDRNGYCFKTPRGRQYFDNADCRPDARVRLTALEKQNVDRIKSWEQRRGCR
ncbi:MAG: caspase family protein [Methyloligellaceae bacterium]